MYKHRNSVLGISVQATDVKLLLEFGLRASKQGCRVFPLSKMLLARLNEMTDKSKLSVLLTHQLQWEATWSWHPIFLTLGHRNGAIPYNLAAMMPTSVRSRPGKTFYRVSANSSNRSVRDFSAESHSISTRNWLESKSNPAKKKTR